jgi:hypothetical protein
MQVGRNARGRPPLVLYLRYPMNSFAFYVRDAGATEWRTRYVSCAATLVEAQLVVLRDEGRVLWFGRKGPSCE